MKILNVGSGSENVSFYGANGTLINPDEHEIIRLDINPDTNPDICLDAKDMLTLPPNEYDIVFSSHCLEHFYKHDVPVVLAGFKHVLKDNGYAYIMVPDLTAVIKGLTDYRNLDLDDVWYRTGQGIPITFHDVLYGWNVQVSQGNLYYAHKCGFTPQSINTVLYSAGFKLVQTSLDGTNITVCAFK